MVGGSLWAQEQYVKERFTPQQGPKIKTPEDMAMEDINEVGGSPLALASREQLLTLYRTDRTKYDVVVNTYKQMRQTSAKNTAIVDGISAQRANNDDQASVIMPSINTLFNGLFSNHVLQTSAKAKETYYKGVLDKYAAGGAVDINAADFTAMSGMHVADMKAGIIASRNTAEQALDGYFAYNSVSDTKQASMRASLDRAAKNMLDNYSTDVGLVAMATVMQVHSDKNVAQQKALIDLFIKQVASGYSTTHVQLFNQGGAPKESLKRDYPNVYNSLQKMYTQMEDAFGAVGESLTRPNTMAAVAAGVEASKTNSGPVVIPASVSVEDKKAIHEVLFKNANDALTKSAIGAGDVSAISCSFATNVEKGPCSQLLAANFSKYKDLVKKLPANDQATIKDASSTASVKSVTSIQELRTGINEIYKVNLSLGVTPEGAVDIIPLPAAKAFSSGAEAAKAAAAIRDNPNAAMEASIARDNYAKATAEFMKRAAPLLNNLVHTRAMLTDESKVSIGQDFSRILNSTTPYKGFYSPVAVAAPAAPATPAASTDTAIPVEEVTSTPEVYAAKTRVAETSGDNKAKNPKTTATGPYQFLEDTWKETVTKYKLPYSLEDRTDPKKSLEVFNLFTKDNTKVLTANLGRVPTDVELYAAQLLGATGAVQFLKGKPTDRARTVASDEAVEKNMEIFYDSKSSRFRTVKEVRAILAKKMS
jgi:hypothetical protein